ncbi:hypothetical protein NBRC116493_12310 [Aurantivibrio infirmus]
MKISLKIFVVSALVFLAACASTPQNPVLGAWDVKLDSPIGELPGTLTFAEDGSGTMMIEAPGAEGQPPAAFQGVTYTDNNIEFSATLDAGGQQISLSFVGAVDGDNLTGNFDTDFGQMAVNGTRKQ